MQTLLFLLVACRPSPVEGTDPAPDPADPADTAPGGDTDPRPEDADAEVIAGRAPGDSLFTDDAVHALAITLSAAAWDSLLAAPKSYVEAEFSDGQRALTVGVRLKGYTSFQPLTGKPNLRVSFDHYVPGQRYDGLEAVDLINEAEDPAAFSEALAYRIFRAAGQPASRTGFAWLQVNDLDYGLYTLVEKKDDVLIRRWWPDDDRGSLYESSSEVWPCDLDDGGAPRCDCWEQDEVGADDARADLEALCALAADTDAADWYEAITAAVDWPEVSGHMAMEMTLDAYDHYAGYRGNVYLYHSPEAEAWSLIPASMNSLYGSTRYVAGSCGGSGRALSDFDGGLLMRRCWDDADCAADQLEAVRAAASALAASDALDAVDAWTILLEPYVVADSKLGYTADQFQIQASCIRAWLAARPAALARELPATCLGEGGSLDVSGWGDLSSNGSCDRSWPDAVSYRVTGISGATLSLAAAPDGLAAGDELLLLVAQGAAGDHAAVGEFAFANVASVTERGLVLDGAPSIAADPATVTLLAQRVPHYAEVRVRAGGLLTAGAWDGDAGGVLAMRVAGTVLVEAGGQISAAGLGYAGGATGPSYNVDGYQGESLEGAGLGGASSSEGYNQANGAWAANLGGGGCNVGGGGGEHAGGATASESWNGTASAPAAGGTYGEADLSALTFGSGGGGVVNLGGSSGPGGAGGGLLFIEADTLIAEGEGALSAQGEDATAWAAGTWTYGAGGGAGGSVWLVAPTMTLATGAVLATGGAGYSGVTRPGGQGGAGRVRLDCDTVNGAACSAATLAGLSEPEAWAGGR